MDNETKTTNEIRTLNEVGKGNRDLCSTQAVLLEGRKWYKITIKRLFIIVIPKILHHVGNLIAKKYKFQLL